MPSLPPLSCTVRGCSEPLRRVERAFVCSRGHAYDLARTGYLNLLQPQDRRSPNAGDSRTAVDARAALIGAGVGRAVIDDVVACAEVALKGRQLPVVVELGSGSGETLGLLAAARPICGAGIDLSTHAATHAARAFPELTWLVANADRRLPLLDGSVDLVLSVHARRNPAECRRVLRSDGRLLVAVPAADDLVELREFVQGDAIERERVSMLLEEHASDFEVVQQARASQRLELDREALLRLLRGTYRGLRLSTSPRVQGLERLVVTLASDIVLFAPRRLAA